MNEEWRDIRGYEGKYQVSNLGRIKSLKDSHGNYREKILKFKLEVSGYLQVHLYLENKVKAFKIHRLVAEAFIPNPNNLPEVNHKDENKENNRVDNLEWCDRKYNINYGTRTQKASEKMKGRKFTENHKKKISKSQKGKYTYSESFHARKVKCITTGKKFNCIKEAGEYYNVYYQSISACCRGKRKSAGKHPITGEKLVWKYIDS